MSSTLRGHEGKDSSARAVSSTGKARFRHFIRTYKAPISLMLSMLALFLIFAFLNPRFASVQNLQNVLFQISVPLIIVVGTTMVIQMGSIDLSVQGVMGAAGMAWILLSPNSRLDLGLAIWAWPVAIGIGLGLGLVTGVVYAKLRVPSFVVSLGTWYVGLGIAIILYGNDLLPSLTDKGLARWPTRLTLGLPNSFWLAAAVVLGGVLVANYTRLGRGLLAIGNNEVVARNSGIPVTRYKIMAFAIAGTLSGVAGILATMQLGSGSPDIGYGQLFTVIPAAVIGGTALSGGEGGVLRSALGVVLLIVLNNGLVLAGVDPDYQQAVFGSILIVTIVAVAWPQRGRLKVAK